MTDAVRTAGMTEDDVRQVQRAAQAVIDIMENGHVVQLFNVAAVLIATALQELPDEPQELAMAIINEQVRLIRNEYKPVELPDDESGEAS